MLNNTEKGSLTKLSRIHLEATYNPAQQCPSWRDRGGRSWPKKGPTMPKISPIALQIRRTAVGQRLQQLQFQVSSVDHGKPNARPYHERTTGEEKTGQGGGVSRTRWSKGGIRHPKDLGTMLKKVFRPSDKELKLASVIRGYKVAGERHRCKQALGSWSTFQN